MNWAPSARIFLRYVVGYLLGRAVGETLAADPDVVLLVSIGLSFAVESFYAMAKRKGWAT